LGVEDFCFKTDSLIKANFILTIREGLPHGGKASLVEGYRLRIPVEIVVLRQSFLNRIGALHIHFRRVANC